MTASKFSDGAATAVPAPARRRVPIRRLLPVLAIAAALAAAFALGIGDYLSLAALRENQAALGTWIDERLAVSVLLYVFLYAGLVAISFPGASALTVAGGFFFGLWIGTAAVVAGATIGAVLLYLAARTVFGDALRERAKGFVGRMERGFRDDELSYMFILRLVPLFPFWAINIAAGVLGVRLRNYVLATLFGIIPGSFVYVSIGRGIAAGVASSDELGGGEVLLQAETLLPLIGLVILALIPVVYKRMRRRDS
ncbi:TVP38/TMEM64 family protein [Parvularcula oceani]|uniref:TVP38/TMEM64 family protein n=1 Tax=Parvularcula oceani TaxID=1247963 RepID=UPI0009E05A6E|nr:TVP38/TMEM64 family protein [Parvularcula oceani]